MIFKYIDIRVNYAVAWNIINLIVNIITHSSPVTS